MGRIGISPAKGTEPGEVGELHIRGQFPAQPIHSPGRVHSVNQARDLVSKSPNVGRGGQKQKREGQHLQKEPAELPTAHPPGVAVVLGGYLHGVVP